MEIKEEEEEIASHPVEDQNRKKQKKKQKKKTSGLIVDKPKVWMFNEVFKLFGLLCTEEKKYRFLMF